MWGFITSLNDILIPHLKAVFDLTYFKAMAVNSAFFGAYFVVSYPAGVMVKKVGYQKGLVIGLLIASVGCAGFALAANVHEYSVFLLALFVLASGITVLQVSANPYVSRLGEEHTASSRLTLTQAFNSLGTTIAPYFGAVLILSVAVLSSSELEQMSEEALNAYNLERSQAVMLPYFMLSAALGALALIFSFLKLPKITQDNAGEIDASDSIWKHSHLVLGVIAIFCYVGAEVAIGSVLTNFFAQPEIGGMPEHEAAKYVSLYWGGAMVVITMMTSGTVAMYAILAVGLFNSIMFPTIFSLAINRLGALSSRGSGVLCMGIVGGALIPPIQGLVADMTPLQFSFFIPVLCYLYIVFYGLKGAIPNSQA
jgi:FHS family L-fucose permease-like MFS transporter